MAISAPEPLRLIGNAEENFHVLGRKHAALYQRMRDFREPTGPLPGLIRAFKGLTQPPAPPLPALPPLGGAWLQAYCEGLEVKVTDYLALLDRLEAGHLRNLAGVLPAGTSVLHWDDAGQAMEHLRLVDWYPGLTGQPPLEILYVKAPGQQEIVSVHPAGLPFLPLSMMNSAGVTLALHPKHHPGDHTEGGPIGPQCWELMLEARSTVDVKRGLKRWQPRRFFGVVSTDPSGACYAADLLGPQHDGRASEGREEKTSVYNGAPLLKDERLAAVASPHHAEIQRLRRQWCQDRVKGVTEGAGLLELTRPTRASRNVAPAITAATSHALAFHPTSHRLELLLAGPPAWAHEGMVVWDNLFQTSMREPRVVPFTNLDSPDASARQRFALAQAAMDRGEPDDAFHELQMGLAQARGEVKALGDWAWPWWQWRHLDGKRDRLHLPQLVRDTHARAGNLYRPSLQFLLFLLEWELQLVPTLAPPDLGPAFKDWADAFLTAAPLKRREMTGALDARLDLQDLRPLGWTKE